MLYRKIMAVFSEIHTKHINTLCGHNVELLNVNPFQPRDAIWHHAFHLFLIFMPFAHWLQ